MRDPYTVLGVARTASADDIKSAFRKLAKKHHPDQNPNDKGAQARFSEISLANEILADPKRRAEFDQGLIGPDGKPRFAGGMGSAGGAGGNPFEGFAGFGGGEGMRNRRRPQGAEDILSELFGAAFSPSQERRKAKSAYQPPVGNDINLQRDVTLAELAAGKVDVELPTGNRLSVKLPMGVADGQVIRLKGQGYSSTVGGQPGDANITIRFRQDNRQRIEGATVTIDVAVPLDIAILGGKVPVDTPDGRIAITIPPMTDGDRVFRLKGRGLADKSGEKGDLLVSVRLMLPKNADRELKALAERLRSTA
jgi:DnaJ-class molecular chaperone